MVIVTAATHQYGNFVTYAANHAKRFGYETIVYDLGGLGFGKEWDFNQQFVDHGYYVQIGNWRSRALHKPMLIRECLMNTKEFVVYLDADAIIADSIDEVETADYDVGVTVRRPGETCPDADYMDFFGRINAGVIFFNNTPASINFCEKWDEYTKEWQNDQRALNRLVNPEGKEIVQGDMLVVDGVKIKCFPTEVYNFYYFPEPPLPVSKIYHYKDGLWKKLVKK